jgi:5-methylcytosine-specific restriction protein A
VKRGRCHEHSQLEPSPDATPRLRGRKLQRLRRRVFIEQPICAVCALERPWQEQQVSQELDHIVPLSRGGTDERHNLRGLCIEHHSKKSVAEQWTR